MRQVLLNSNDITELVTKIPPLMQSSGDLGGLILNDISSIEGINGDGFWDVTNDASPFYLVADFQDFEIIIVDNGTEVFHGGMLAPISDMDTFKASITLQSRLQRILNRRIIHFASNDNPANIVKNLLEILGIEYDFTSFANASIIYNLNQVLINVYIPAPTMTGMELLQQIVNIGVARLYAEKSVIYYDVIQERTNIPLFVVSDRPDNPDGITLKQPYKVEPLQKQKMLGYSISYEDQIIGPGSAVVGAEIDRSFSIDGTNSAPIRIVGLQSATWIGKRWKEYFNAVKTRVTFGVPAEIGKDVKLAMPCTFQYRNKADAIIDIDSIDPSSIVTYVLSGIIR